MNTTSSQAFKEYFAPTMKLVVNNRASKHLPLQNISLSAPMKYEVAYVSRVKSAAVLLITFIHLFVFITIAKNYQQNSHESGDIAPMLVSLISATKSNISKNSVLPTVTSKAHVKIDKKTPVVTQEKSTLFTNEMQEVNQKQVEPVLDKVSLAMAPVNEGAKLSEQKTTPEISFEPPRFNADYLHNPAPEYPGMSRRRGEQGRVTLKVVVNVNGEAEQIQIDQSSGFELLDKAALSAVKNWKFIPAKSNRQPVVGAVIVPVRFTLDS
jgi:protein TonB